MASTAPRSRSSSSRTEADHGGFTRNIASAYRVGPGGGVAPGGRSPQTPLGMGGLPVPHTPQGPPAGGFPTPYGVGAGTAGQVALTVPGPLGSAPVAR